MASSVILVVLGVVGMVLFVVPNHGKKSSGERPSLLGSLVGLLREPPPRWQLAVMAISVGWVLGCLSVFLPALTLGLARSVGDERVRVVFGVGGVAMLVGAPVALFVMAFSVASFGWGGGRLANPNFMMPVIPIFVGACGVLAIVLAAWGKAAMWAVGG